MNLKQLIIPAILAALITGCSSTPDADQNGAPVESRDNGIATVDANNLDGRGLPRELTDPKSILSKRSVYFDFDSSAVKGEYKPVVEAHAGYLKKNPQRKAQIQGNTDALGSREYNLALGQRRAESVKSMMRVLGVPENQLEAVSYGKEKLRATGSSDADNAENRRADVAYDGE